MKMDGIGDNQVKLNKTDLDKYWGHAGGACL
jgi:hypothetical protein